MANGLIRAPKIAFPKAGVLEFVPLLIRMQYVSRKRDALFGNDEKFVQSHAYEGEPQVESKSRRLAQGERRTQIKRLLTNLVQTIGNDRTTKT